MFCTQCGTQAKESEKFCTKCGAPLIVSLQSSRHSIQWTNPFQCRTPFMRLLSNGIAVIALISWIGWVASVSDGFTDMQLIGWLVFTGVPVITYLALIFGVQSYYKAPMSKTIRYVTSSNIIWIFLVSAWGYIWGWDSVFREKQYLALFVLPILGSWLSVLLWRWSTKE